jgi:hypothetical protein
LYKKHGSKNVLTAYLFVFLWSSRMLRAYPGQVTQLICWCTNNCSRSTALRAGSFFLGARGGGDLKCKPMIQINHTA